MPIYLVRHTTPLSTEGICYGQTDVPLAPSFAEEAAKIRQLCPERPEEIYSSSLERCMRLARYLWPEKPIVATDSLREMNFGNWENKPWSEIDALALNTWMEDFVHAAVPGGESYEALYKRCVAWWTQTIVSNQTTVIITHAGVIRSLLCYSTSTALSDSFNTILVPLGAVYRLHKENDHWESRLL